MTRKIFSVAILSLLTLAFLGMSAFAAKEAPAKRVIDPQVYKSLQYSFPYPDEHPVANAGADRTVPAQQLGTAAPSVSPGTTIGNTYYDYQHNGTMGRMVETNFGTAAVVHFSWMFLPGPVLESREYDYYSYDITNSTQGTVTGLQPDDDYAGYVGITTTNDNRAVVGGHNNAFTEGLNAPQVYWDFGEATSFFGANARVPRALQEYQAQKVDQEVIWPKFRYVEGATDTVLHIIAQAALDNAADPQSIYYFRRVGGDDNPGATWTFPPYIIDTIYDLSHDIAATDDGKVALVWTANLPCSAADPDTASGYECRTYVQLDNDVYYQVSTDYGVSFQPRVNLTNYILTEGTDSYRPYTDMSALYDSNGDLHIVWAARQWPAGSQDPGGQAGLYAGRIFHWSTNQPFIRTAVSADWDQTVCSPGAWNLNAGKMSVSECNGRFYILFVQINNIPAGIEDDCAVNSNPGFPTGSGNGDLYVVVSEDGGLTWDKERNATDSYTPGCDSVGGAGGPCDNDNWPSMARFGTNYALNPGDNATDVVVLPGGSDNGWYLDVQYINDKSAGGIVQSEGTWQQADVRWFRLACVEAVTAPNPIFSPNEIAYPAWVKPGATLNKTITIENLGNEAYNYTAPPATVETQGTGWLSTSGFSGFVDFGVSNTATGTITADASAYSSGTIAQLTGLVIFTGNPAGPDTLPVSVIVTDSLVPPVPDTISTPCLSLAVLNQGEFGNQGSGKVNMDFYDAGDCDTNAVVYLYDGSPIIGWIDGADTIGNWSVFGNSYLSDVGFFQLSEGSKSTDAVAEVYSSTFSTRDTSLLIEKTYYAPQNVDSCNFIIQRLKIWSGDGNSHAGLTVGEAIDWDIPADSASRNGSGINEAAGLIYQNGGEYHQDDTGANAACQDNDIRYGGMKFLAQYTKTSDWTDLGAVSGAYTADNPTYVYGNDNGFLPGELYEKMQETGFATYSSANPDSLYTDLHMVMTYQTGYTVNVGETLVVFTALVAEENGGLSGFTSSAAAAYAWYCDHVIPSDPGCGCCVLRADVDHSGTLNVSDLTTLVGILFQGQPAAPCFEESDVDASGTLNVSDLTTLVGILFQGQPPAPPC